MFDERIALGIPSLAGYSLRGALEKAAGLGFQSVMSLPDGPRAEHSLGPFPTLAFYGLGKEQRQELTDSLARFRHVAIHQAWDDKWSRWIDCAACVGAKIVTVHSGRPHDGQNTSAFLAERSEQLRRMGDYAGALDVRIGIENEGGMPDDYLGLVEAVAHPHVGATLDVGHCAYFGHVTARRDHTERVSALNATIGSMVRALNQRLFSIHAHDVRQSDWRDHRCAGSGVIDFPALFAELRGIRYAGLIEIELEEPEKETAAAATGKYLTGLCQHMSAKTASAEPAGPGAA